MNTKIIRMHTVDEEILLLPAQIIRNGGLVAFPTETVYGLGANGLDAAAAAGIYAAKGRPSDNPLILHIADRAMLDRLAEPAGEAAALLMDAFWPGPLTLILRRRGLVPDRITGGLDTVGIRMPDHAIARALIRLAGVPIAAPSANTSGRPSPTAAAAVLEDLDGKIDLIIDGGDCRFGLESTIVDCTGEMATVLRPGAITSEMLAAVVGEVRLDPALAGADCVPKAPGMKYTHYAPKAPMILLEGAADQMAAALTAHIMRAQAEGKRVGAIVSAETAAGLPEGAVISVYGKRGEIGQIAAHLYRSLRSFDHSAVDVIFAEGTAQQGLGLAVMNRMHKASGYRIISV